jgi:DinB superfamily
MEAPQYPAGAFVLEVGFGPERRAEFIAVLEAEPAALRRAIDGLSDEQLDTRYRNWTVRQIVHHLADSHVNSYVRFKLALTEERPTIKPYDEGRWSALDDARTGDVRVPLALLDALHARWVQLLRCMTASQFARTFFHPETGTVVSLDEALGSYAWHCKHHTAQVAWLRTRHGW